MSTLCRRHLETVFLSYSHRHRMSAPFPLKVVFALMSFYYVSIVTSLWFFFNRIFLKGESTEYDTTFSASTPPTNQLIYGILSCTFLTPQHAIEIFLPRWNFSVYFIFLKNRVSLFRLFFISAYENQTTL